MFEKFWGCNVKRHLRLIPLCVLLFSPFILVTTCEMQLNKAGKTIILRIVVPAPLGGSKVAAFAGTNAKDLSGGTSVILTITPQPGTSGSPQTFSSSIGGKTVVDFSVVLTPGTYQVSAQLLDESGNGISQVASTQTEVPTGNPVILTILPALVTGITIIPGTPSDGSSVSSGVWTPGTSPSTLQLTASVSPSNATNKSVTWSLSGGGGDVTVSNTGLISVNDSIAPGSFSATITVTANDGSGVTVTFTVSGTNFG